MNYKLNYLANWDVANKEKKLIYHPMYQGSADPSKEASSSESIFMANTWAKFLKPLLYGKNWQSGSRLTSAGLSSG